MPRPARERRRRHSRAGWQAAPPQPRRLACAPGGTRARGRRSRPPRRARSEPPSRAPRMHPGSALPRAPWRTARAPRPTRRVRARYVLQRSRRWARQTARAQHSGERSKDRERLIPPRALAAAVTTSDPARPVRPRSSGVMPQLRAGPRKGDRSAANQIRPNPLTPVACRSSGRARGRGRRSPRTARGAACRWATCRARPSGGPRSSAPAHKGNLASCIFTARRSPTRTSLDRENVCPH